MKNVVTLAALTLVWTQVGLAGNIDAKALYNNTCATCHGVKAEKHALGRSEVIANNDYNDILSNLQAFKNGKGDKIMQAQVAKFNMDELKAIAHYITTLKDPTMPSGKGDNDEDEKKE